MLSALTKRIPRSISIRIAFLFCVTFAVGLFFAFLVTYFEVRHSLEKSSREILSSKLQEAKTVLVTKGVSGLKDFMSLEKNRILNSPFLIRVITVQGETIYMKPSMQEKNFDFNLAFQNAINPQEYLGWHSLPAVDDEDRFNLLTEKADSNFYIQVGKSSEEREDILDEILLDFAMMEVILIILSGFFGSWYARKSLAPLRHLLSTIRSIEKGNLSKRMITGGSADELHEISAAFNRMIERIEKLIQVMGESLDNVAHDIRTPLTRIRSVAENALLSQDPSILRESLEDTAESTIHIAEIVDQLLSIAEAEAGTLQLKFEKVLVKTMLAEIIEIYEFTALDKSILIEINDVPDDLFWKLDRKKMKQAIANLVDNAIKYSPANTRVRLKTSMHDSVLKITVADQGFGIGESEKEKIWNRLYRGDKSRSTKGLGLGLSIVRAVVLAHGGTTVVNALSVGTEFSITVPAMDLD